MIKDRGAKGLGKKVIPPIKKGNMTKLARKYGYISGNQTVNDIPHSKMDDLTRDLVLKEGLSEKSVAGMYQAQIVFRKREITPEGKEFKRQMEVGRAELKNIPNLSTMESKLESLKTKEQKLSKKEKLVSAMGYGDVSREDQIKLRKDLKDTQIQIAELKANINIRNK